MRLPPEGLGRGGDSYVAELRGEERSSGPLMEGAGGGEGLLERGAGGEDMLERGAGGEGLLERAAGGKGLSEGAVGPRGLLLGTGAGGWLISGMMACRAWTTALASGRWAASQVRQAVIRSLTASEASPGTLQPTSHPCLRHEWAADRLCSFGRLPACWQQGAAKADKQAQGGPICSLAAALELRQGQHADVVRIWPNPGRAG